MSACECRFVLSYDFSQVKGLPSWELFIASDYLYNKYAIQCVAYLHYVRHFHVLM